MKRIAITIILICLVLTFTDCKKRQQPLVIKQVKYEKSFSVSESKSVYFAKGNLQYQASTDTWRFAENQWDYVGDGNSNISPTYSGWIDLFGWGTGNNPTQSSENPSDYMNFTDWGSNNISNGDGKNWFTLTKDEWAYVFYKRNTSSGIRFARATLNGVDGVIILPDDWKSSNYNLDRTNFFENYNYNNINIISPSAWTSKLEANGAVFLPEAGYRRGMTVWKVGSLGYYWSATYYGSDGAYGMDFQGETSLWFPRDYGRSVRLVCDAKN